MRFEYFKPRADIRSLVSSYYNVTVDDDVADIMRAEIANVRFVVRGSIASDINGKLEQYGIGSALLCGPTHKWSNVEFSPDTQVFGAAITPLGWARMFGIDADQLADKVVPLKTYVPPAGLEQFDCIFNGTDESLRVEACNNIFASLVNIDRHINAAFLEQISAWITSPDPNELIDLFEKVQLSKRQVERLSKKYFGSPPKLLHRKFRALHSANRLTWQELTDWKDIATTAYYDQSHFIREFKQFNGRTPSEFIKGTHILVRMTLQERLQIAHESPFSLIG